MDPLIILAFCFGIIVGFLLDQLILPSVVVRWARYARLEPRNDE